jgi:hypothetical protein
MKKLSFVACLLLLALPALSGQALSLGAATDSSSDSMQSNGALELLGIEGDLNASDELKFTATLGGAFLSSEPATSNIRLNLDTNLDARPDYTIDLRRFTLAAPYSGAGYLDGFESLINMSPTSIVAANDCSVYVEVRQATVTFEVFNLPCLGNLLKIGFQFQSMQSGRVLDQVPNVGFLIASTDPRDQVSCTSASKGETHLIREVDYMCVLISGTMTKGRWGLVPLREVSTTSFLRMFECSQRQKDAVTWLNNSSGEKVWRCMLRSNKWTWVDNAVWEAEQLAASKRARADLIAKAKFIPAKAYYTCNLDHPSKFGTADLREKGRTLVLTDDKSYYNSWADWRCVARALKMPAALSKTINDTVGFGGSGNTNSGSGRWGPLAAWWSFNREQGLTLTIKQSQ